MVGMGSRRRRQWLENMGVDVARYVIFAVAVWLVLWVVLRGVLQGPKDPGGDAASPSARRRVPGLDPVHRDLLHQSAFRMFMLEGAGLLPGPALAAQLGLAWAHRRALSSW